MTTIDINNMQPDFGSFTDVFANVKILGNFGMLSAFFSVLVMLLITRNVSLWGIMWWPILILLSFIGMPVGVLLHVAAGMVFIGSIFKRIVGVNILAAARKRIMPSEREEIQKLAADKRMLSLQKGGASETLKAARARRKKDQRRRVTTAVGGLFKRRPKFKSIEPISDLDMIRYMRGIK